MDSSIEYLPKKDQFRIGDVKNLAVTEANKNDISKSFPTTPVVSNADMLSQSFGTNISQPVDVAPKVEEQPVQVTGIPTTNSFNMESVPVNMSTAVSAEPVMPVIEPITNTVNEVKPVENVSQSVPTLSVDISNTPAPNNGIESGFKVSNEPNIFDNPTIAPLSISESDLNKPTEIVENKDVNVFSQPQETDLNNPVVAPENNHENKINLETINDDIILAQMAIEESNVKHYEALAENSKKKVELLKRQIKGKEKEDVNKLENTASDLFNNNGILDEEKVLGKTPFPNLTAA